MPVEVSAPSEQGVYLTKVYIWPRCIFDQGVYLTKVYIWPRCIFDQGVYLTRWIFDLPRH